MTTASSSVRSLASQPRSGTAAGSARWLVYYYVIEIVCQLALLWSALASFRIVFRTAAYATSLAALFLTGNKPRLVRQPASTLALVVLLILGLETIANPGTVSVLGAMATTGLYLAILAPIFWVARLELSKDWFRHIITVLWAFHSLSALFGALQVYFPGTFQPAVSVILDRDYVSSLEITLANGDHILRPSGLSDVPGGAAVAGTYAIILALGLWSNERRWWFRLLLASSIAVGMFVLYVCQIRSLVVMVGIALLAASAAYAVRGNLRQVLTVAVLGAGVAIVAFIAAASVGGAEITSRLSTLIEASPSEVYYTNRGIFLEHTLTDLLPEYPLGAGLAHWGMAASYFSSSSSHDLIYVEIQWTGWLLDGGILLMVVYLVMVLVTTWTVFTVATRRGAHVAPELGNWAAIILGYDLGTLALTFNFPVFMSGFGMDFWILNTALLTMAAQTYNSSSVSAGQKSGLRSL